METMPNPQKGLGFFVRGFPAVCEVDMNVLMSTHIESKLLMMTLKDISKFFLKSNELQHFTSLSES